MKKNVIVHPTAVVAPEAKFEDNVNIGPYCIIGPDVVIGEGTRLRSHVVIDGHVTIGKNNDIYQFCSIGAPPQDVSYKGEPTRVVIGDNNIFREYVSIHRGTLKQDQITIVGSNCLFMAYVHVGHDVRIGDKVVLVNTTNIAGHVTIGDRVIIGGGTFISQFITLGRGAYIGGATAIDHDIPPFCTALGNRVHLKGINIIGMRRHGYSKETVSEVVDFFRTMESSVLSPRAWIEKKENIETYTNNDIVKEMTDFIRKSEIGIAPFISSP